MKKFIAASLFILLAGPLWIFLTQKNSVHLVPESFLNKTTSLLAAQTAPLNAVPASQDLAAQSTNDVPMNAGELNTFILNRSVAPDKRRQILQQLIEGGPKGLAEMAAVAKSPVPQFPDFRNPHSSDYGYYKFEKSLRITAIETLDQWAVKGTDVTKELMQIRDSQKEQDLVFLASLAVSGIQEGRPGKVTRFIDQAFDEALNGK